MQASAGRGREFERQFLTDEREWFGQKSTTTQRGFGGDEAVDAQRPAADGFFRTPIVLGDEEGKFLRSAGQFAFGFNESVRWVTITVKREMDLSRAVDNLNVT